MSAAPTPLAPDLGHLVRLLNGRRLSVLTGAGCSTESGIPDYRGPETRRRARNPIQYRAFVKSRDARRRYWARAVLGWDKFKAARPNPAHHALASLERKGLLTGLITQNVDRLHQAAGSRNIVELHGALADVRCIACRAVEPRAAVQARMAELNPGWTQQQAEMAPDGDAELDGERIARFVLATCLMCDGDLKPDVVFFGESVPRLRVETAYHHVESSDALLVAGSSLAVFSGYRFVRRAEAAGLPVAIVNLGPTRGDPHATLRVDGRLGDVLPRLAAALHPLRA
ncbi:MAG: NAD-dependent protein deacetylase [Sandaracinaceae bacterium]